MTTSRAIRVFNAQGASETKPWDEVEAAITKPSVYGEVDVWLGCELAWADLDAIAERHGLHALQYGERGSAEAGVGILSRRPIADGSMLEAVRSTSEGGGIRMRPITTGRTSRMRVSAIHAHPQRAPVAQRVYMARVKATPGIVGGDFNREAAWMRTNFERQYRGIGVLGLLVPARWKSSPAKPVDIGSDHPAVDVVLTRR